MSEVALDIEIRIGTMLSIEVAVARWDDPALDHAVVASRADLRLGRTAAAGEDDGANDVEVAAQSKPDLELLWIPACTEANC